MASSTISFDDLARAELGVGLGYTGPATAAGGTATGATGLGAGWGFCSTAGAGVRGWDSDRADRSLSSRSVSDPAGGGDGSETITGAGGGAGRAGRLVCGAGGTVTFGGILIVGLDLGLVALAPLEIARPTKTSITGRKRLDGAKGASGAKIDMRASAMPRPVRIRPGERFNSMSEIQPEVRALRSRQVARANRTAA